LLPLARSVVLSLVVVIAALAILSELGVNIAPLLAGAGVIGLAVGFGAQTLVKDIITGAFILFEDTIAVGDYIEVAGCEGTIEALTVRTIKLRDVRGTVHTIPFSSVETVTNYTKDYAYHLAEIGVAYRENTDDVAKVLREIGEELRADPKFSNDIIAPTEIMGLDRFEDSAVVIRARLKTKPGKQWRIKREYNRRVKLRFDELGIEIPFPHTTIFFGEDKEGAAPAAHVVVETPPQGK
jgi:small conductance mechanosensitive channel